MSGESIIRPWFEQVDGGSPVDVDRSPVHPRLRSHGPFWPADARVRWLAVFALIVTFGALICGGTRAEAATQAALPDPFAGGRFFVDPASPASAPALQAQMQGRRAEARALRLVADTPQSMWFIAADDPDRSAYVHDFFTRAALAGSDTMIAVTLHGLPDQVCAGENAPGAQSADQYRSWINGYARLIGDRRAAIFLEPDALAASPCLAPSRRRLRNALMTYAARVLSALPRTGVYEDIGAGDWRSLSQAARLLREAGIRFARGFALNATHYDWTRPELAYGVRLARLLGGKHFVINTAFNGRGPRVGPHGFHEWCNPSGRALGPLPTVRTPNRLADAFYWIGNPGLSDGHCNGGPTVGEFWLDWALELADNSAAAPDFPVYRSGH